MKKTIFIISLMLISNLSMAQNRPLISNPISVPQLVQEIPLENGASVQLYKSDEGQGIVIQAQDEAFGELISDKIAQSGKDSLEEALNVTDLNGLSTRAHPKSVSELSSAINPVLGASCHKYVVSDHYSYWCWDKTADVIQGTLPYKYTYLGFKLVTTTQAKHVVISKKTGNVNGNTIWAPLFAPLVKAHSYYKLIWKGDTKYSFLAEIDAVSDTNSLFDFAFAADDDIIDLYGSLSNVSPN